MKKLNFKIQNLVATILTENSKSRGVLIFLRNELRELRKG